MAKFYVYFDQVNQSRYQVEAKDRDEAIEKAQRIWKGENRYPSGAHVEPIKENPHGR